MTTVYLHIGTPKTGSSSLQTFLFNNRDKLLKKGVLYPLLIKTVTYPQNSGQKRKKSHHNLHWSLTKDPESIKSYKAYNPMAGDWTDLHKEIDELNPKPDKIIISAESFYDLLPPENIPLIKKYLKGYKTKIIVCLRNQYEYFRSYYCLRVKVGYKNSLRQFILENKAQGDYFQMLSPWSEVFGKENIIVVPYNKNGIINDFLQKLNIDIEINSDTNADSTNFRLGITPDYKVVKAMQIFNKFFPDNRVTIKLKFAVQDLYKSEAKKKDSKLFNKISQIPDFLISRDLMTEAERVEIMKIFEDSNKKVAQEYMGKEDGGLFE